MPKKLTVLGALTVALVFGYMGLFAGTTQGAIQSFVSSGVDRVSVTQCYDDDITKIPVDIDGAGPGTRIGCDPANSIPAAGGLPVYNWTVVNLPVGNRLTLPATYTPSGVNQWSSAPVLCSPVVLGRCQNNGGLGVTTGNVSSRTDIGCNATALGGIDILASNGTGGAPSAGWPNYTDWVPPNYGRIAQAPTVLTDEDAYVHAAAPFPASFTFVSVDMAILPFLWLSGTVPFPIEPNAKLATVVYSSSYVPGLNVSVALLGGSPSNPASDDLVLCLDSPQDSIGQTNVLLTPAVATRIPRWTLLQSAADLGDDTTNRLLNWQCDVIGAPAGADIDGDCLVDSSDPNTALTDTDGDLVPDGVEVFSGSLPNDLDGDSDNDGAKDYDELFQFTNPLVADTDGDGQADKQDVIPTNGANASPSCPNPEVGAIGGGTCLVTGGALGLGLDQFDATDDNCPADANPNQLNTDSLWQYHGMGGNDPTAINSGTGDRTNPDEDPQGDVCDTDKDNDGLPNETETLMRIRQWSGNQDDTSGGGLDPEGKSDGTSLCTGPDPLPGTFLPGSVAGSRPLSDVKGDSDFDYVLDGRECAFRSRPDASINIAGITNEAQRCVSGAVAVPPYLVTNTKGGCAQPAGTGTTCTPVLAANLPSPTCNGSAGPDSDTLGTDGLRMPFGGAAGHLGVEIFYRTRQISQLSPAVQVDDIDLDLSAGNNDNDSDRDLRGLTGTQASLKDGLEVLFLHTDPSSTDSDGDGCEDGDEWADISGDGAQGIADTGLRAAAAGTAGADGNHDAAPTNGEIDSTFVITIPPQTLLTHYEAGANRDLNKDGVNNVADSGILLFAINNGASCSFTEGGPAAFPTNRATLP